MQLKKLVQMPYVGNESHEQLADLPQADLGFRNPL